MIMPEYVYEPIRTTGGSTLSTSPRTRRQVLCRRNILVYCSFSIILLGIKFGPVSLIRTALFIMGYLLLITALIRTIEILDEYTLLVTPAIRATLPADLHAVVTRMQCLLPNATMYLIFDIKASPGSLPQFDTLVIYDSYNTFVEPLRYQK